MPYGKYNFNKNFFDKIDTENKAYWLGFIWCDGGVTTRQKTKKYREFSFKIDLAECDLGHLEKLKKDLNSNHPIKVYTYKNSFKEGCNASVCRFHISNKYFGCNLHENYGLISHRFDPSLVISNVPKELFKHFIRGVMDADGSITYYVNDGHHKIISTFSTYELLIDEINKFLLDEGIVQSILKKSRRHEDRDDQCVNIKFCGVNQGMRVLDYLYKDASIYLDRKYNQYLEIKKMVELERSSH